MRWIEFTDLHLSHRDKLGEFRFHDKMKIVSEVVDAAIEERADFVVSLGDTFSHARMPRRYKRIFYGEISRLWKNNIQIFMLVGNHELTAFDTLFDDEIEVANHSEFLRIVRDAPQLFSTSDASFIFCPYAASNESLLAMVDAARKSSFLPIVVFAHKGFAASGYWATDSDLSAQDVAGRIDNTYWRFGHFHVKGDPMRNVSIIGSAAFTDFSEEGSKKFYYVGQTRADGVDYTAMLLHDRKAVSVNLQFSELEQFVDDAVGMEETLVKVTVYAHRADLRAVNKQLRVLQEKVAAVRRKIIYVEEEASAASQTAILAGGIPEEIRKLAREDEELLAIGLRLFDAAEAE